MVLHMQVAAGVLMALAALVIAWILSGKKIPRRSPGKLFWWMFLLLLWPVGGVLLVSRWTEGLGTVTHLRDDFPWGLWKFNVLYGVALAAGGFVTAGAVYVFRLRPFYPILRTAILTAFLSYSFLGLISLLIDIGRPLNFWSPFIHWQHHSVLFEVFWCISLYTVVLTVEFSPILLERLRWNRLVRAIHAITLPSVIAGVILSTLHQSSLGSLFLIVPNKLLPLWYSPLLPVYFFLSAVATGVSMIILVSRISLRVLGKGPDSSTLVALSRAIPPVLLIYLFLRVIDVTARDAWVFIFRYPAQGLSFALEAGLLVLPVILLLNPRLSESRHSLNVAVASVILGVVLNRLNVAWFGLLTATGTIYIPSWQEIIVTVNLISYAVVIFGLAARYLPVFAHRRTAAPRMA
jgi:Ni/Fe-hydrogenase subunit HybB-like protein